MSLQKLVSRVTRPLQKALIGPGKLVAKDPSFYIHISKNTLIEKVASGFQFTEGPLWLPEDRSLIFSDIPGNTIHKLSEFGEVTIFRNPSQNSNGLTMDPDGNLIACEHGSRQVTKTDSDGSISVLANIYEDCVLNSPNDVVVKKDGSVYFTDPPYGIKADDQVQDFQGVYRLSPDGDLSCVVTDFDRPNGLAFSPDEQHLYIDDSTRNHIRVFDLCSDGSLTNGRVFCDMNLPKPGCPDGMKVDETGTVYCTGPGGVWVISPCGKHLGSIVLPEIPSNCAWGGSDFRTLYITARTSVYRVQVNISGVGSFIKNEAPNKR